MKAAFITGITSSIGKAIASRLEAEGWRVLGTARHLSVEQEGYEADLSLLEGVEPLAVRVGEDLKPLDAFIHVAGVWHDGSDVMSGKKLEEFSTRQITNTINVGFTSAVVLTARLLPFMNHGGSCVYISGTFQDGGANWLPYYVSKKALESFVVGLASDQPGLRIHAVAPGPTASEALKTHKPEQAGTAQPPMSVAKVVTDLLVGSLKSDSGTIIEVKDSQISLGLYR